MTQNAASPAGHANLVAEVEAAIAANDMTRAVALAQAGLAEGIEHSILFNLAAYQLELDERFSEALDMLGRALRLNPRDAFVINSIGVCHSKLGRPEDALAAFEGALRINPDFPYAHNGRGLALATLGDRPGARAAHEHAAALDPNFAEPLGALAAMDVEDKDLVSARRYAERALKLDEEQPAAVLAMAAVEMEDGDFAPAEARLRRLLSARAMSPLHLASALNLQAEALDALERYEEAMRAYKAANAQLRSVHMVRFQETGAELGLDLCRRIIDVFRDAPADVWRTRPQLPPASGEARKHVFLIGFPRSGTTLLEQVLASHPDMVALEEKATLDSTLLDFFHGDRGVEALAELSEAEASERRDEYWRKVRSLGVEPAGKIFVDKQPLYTVYLPAVAKLFPEAKILFARRDPRDVVVSCLRRRFRGNTLVSEFTNLERAALLYDAVMMLADIYREKLSLDIYIHRHESLVEDFDTEVQAICAFIGVPWSEAMRDFAETAKRRDVRTPSAKQVRRGLYREGMGQWRRYGDEVSEILPILEPWVAAFGYQRS